MVWNGVPLSETAENLRVALVDQCFTPHGPRLHKAYFRKIVSRIPAWSRPQRDVPTDVVNLPLTGDTDGAAGSGYTDITGSVVGTRSPVSSQVLAHRCDPLGDDLIRTLHAVACPISGQ